MCFILKKKKKKKNCTIKPAHAVPLASARQHPETQKENQAGHSPEVLCFVLLRLKLRSLEASLLFVRRARFAALVKVCLWPV